MRVTLAAVVLFGIVAGQAEGGTLAVSLKTASGTQSATVNVPDADIARMVTAQKAIEVAKAHVKAGDPPPPAPTDAALLQTIANDVVRSLARNTLSYERQQAARAAMQTVKPIAVPQP